MRIWKCVQGSRHTAALLAVVLAVVSGCGKKPQPSGRTPSSRGSTASAPIVEAVLTVWQQGDQPGAINRFLETDWNQRPLFTPGSTLSLSEQQFIALSVSEREEKSKEMMPQLTQLKNLAQAVAQAGREAASRKDQALARKHFVAVQQYGAALDTEESMQIVRLVGRALTKLGIGELAKLEQ